MARRRKKKVVAKEIKGPQEYAGYTLGQEVWVRMDIYGGIEWAFGSIMQFHPDDNTEPSFSLFDKVRKRYAVGAINNIADSPPKKWMSKVSK